MTSTIEIIRPKRHWSLSPANLLPTALLVHLFWRHPSYTVMVDDRAVGKIKDSQAKVFDVEPGEHRLHLRFVGLRTSKELLVSLEDGEQRQFLCATSAMGWPTLREASPEEVAGFAPG